MTSGHLVTGGRGLPPCRPPLSASLHLRPLASLEAFGGRDPGPALVYGQLHLVHQAQPDLQLQHDDVVHEDGVDEEDDPGAAVEDDEDVAELLGAFLYEKSAGPGESQEEGEENPGLQLAHHVLHARHIPGDPGPVGGQVGFTEDKQIEDDHTDGRPDIEPDEGLLLQPAVVGVLPQVGLRVVLDDVADEDGQEGEDQWRPVAHQVPDQGGVLAGVGVSQVVGADGSQQLQSL